MPRALGVEPGAARAHVGFQAARSSNKSSDSGRSPRPLLVLEMIQHEVDQNLPQPGDELRLVAPLELAKSPQALRFVS